MLRTQTQTALPVSDEGEDEEGQGAVGGVTSLVSYTLFTATLRTALLGDAASENSFIQ